MYSLSTTHYYGLPQEIWDDLIAKAEDLLIEEGIGQHLLAVYPAGDRIYGKESSSQGLFCLYMDTVESILDPRFHNKIKFHKINEGNQNSPIYFLEFHSWVKWLCAESRLSDIQGDHDKHYLKHLNIIPSFGDTIYQDQAIDKIISIVEDKIINTKIHLIDKPWSECPGAKKPTYDNLCNYAIYLRTQMIMKLHGRFMPNLNSNWGEVFKLYELHRIDSNLNLTKELYNIDEKLQKMIKENKKELSMTELDRYIALLGPLLRINYSYINPPSLDELAKETIKLYKTFV